MTTSEGDDQPEAAAAPTTVALVAMDTGALTTAIVAAGAAFFAQPGDWTFLSVVLGVAFLLVLLAYHRPLEGDSTVQGVFVRGAFAGTVALSLCIIAGPPLQLAAQNAGMANEQHKAADAVTEWVSWAWVPITLVVYWLEPRLTRALMRSRTGRPARGQHV